jgi:hypothetical protein
VRIRTYPAKTAAVETVQAEAAPTMGTGKAPKKPSSKRVTKLPTRVVALIRFFMKRPCKVSNGHTLAGIMEALKSSGVGELASISPEELLHDMSILKAQLMSQEKFRKSDLGPSQVGALWNCFGGPDKSGAKAIAALGIIINGGSTLGVKIVPEEHLALPVEFAGR